MFLHGVYAGIHFSGYDAVNLQCNDKAYIVVC